MKIRLKVNIPVAKEYGLTAGWIMETVDPPKGRDSDEMWVMGNIHKAVRVLPYEVEVL